ncbi:MAG: zinc-dependent alcohol dehydrogenase family protein [Acetobacteraceae bacterium]
MRGVVFTGGRELALMDFPDPTPGPGEVVVEIKASGMCGSDLGPYRAPRGGASAALGLGAAAGPVIAGHEPCGVIAALGPSVAPHEAPPGWALGARVMVHHYRGCGLCPHCRTGWTQMCDAGATVFGITGHGGHAPFMKVPASTLVALPNSLSFAAGAAISCGTGTAYGALRRIRLSGHDTIAIFGQGPVGLSATQLARAMGARVIAFDPSPDRLARAQDFGAETALDPRANDPAQVVGELTHGRGADLALDASGTAEGRSAAVRATGKWGTVCFVGEGGKVSIDVSPEMLRKQLTIVASWTFSTAGQAECARFVAERAIPLDALFTNRWTLDQAAEAYRLFDQQQSGKGVFLM